LRETLERQRERVHEELTKHKRDFTQLTFDFGDEEKRQLESEMRSWRSRLEQFERDLEREPQRIPDFYEVRAKRIEPVGLVYLWPHTRARITSGLLSINCLANDRIRPASPPFRTLVHGADGIRRQRTEAHGRNVQYRGRIGLAAPLAADRHAKIGVRNRDGSQRMIDPLVTGSIDIFPGPKRLAVLDALCALVHQRALRAREGHRLVIGFHEVLPQLWADGFKKETDVSQERIIAQDRMPCLQQVVYPQQADRGRRRREP
jgi:hypothetical protein